MEKTKYKIGQIIKITKMANKSQYFFGGTPNNMKIGTKGKITGISKQIIDGKEGNAITISVKSKDKRYKPWSLIEEEIKPAIELKTEEAKKIIKGEE